MWMPLAMIMKPFKQWLIIDWWIEFVFSFSQYWSYAYNNNTNTISSFYVWSLRIDICLNYNWLSSPIINWVNIYIYDNDLLIWTWWTSYTYNSATPPIKKFSLNINYITNKITWLLDENKFLDINIDLTWKKTWTFWIDYFSWPEFWIWDRWHKIFYSTIYTFNSSLDKNMIFYDQLFNWDNWEFIKPQYQSYLYPWIYLRSRDYNDSWSKTFINCKKIFNFN